MGEVRKLRFGEYSTPWQSSLVRRIYIYSLSIISSIRSTVCILSSSTAPPALCLDSCVPLASFSAELHDSGAFCGPEEVDSNLNLRGDRPWLLAEPVSRASRMGDRSRFHSRTRASRVGDRLRLLAGSLLGGELAFRFRPPDPFPPPDTCWTADLSGLLRDSG